MNKPSVSNFYTSIFGDDIPVPEVIEDDHATGWLLWDESVNESDSLLAMRYAPTESATLSVMG